MARIQIETGRCGWGIVGGLIPEMRMGWLRLSFADADFAAMLQRLRDALGGAEKSLTRLLDRCDDLQVRNAALVAENLRQATHIAQLELALGDADHITTLAAELMAQ